MQNPSDSMETAEPEANGQGGTVDSSVVDDSTPGPERDSATASTVIVELLPGVAIVFGDIPPELELDPIDFRLVPADDRTQISSTLLASIGHVTNVGGNLRNAYLGGQGVYRLSDATRALMKAGGKLAIKDGANLGTVIVPGGLAQARFIPVASVGVASAAAAIGPVLSMVALQLTLGEITSLVRTNIALTSQVLTTIRHEQWSELASLVETVDDTIAKARDAESVTLTLWDSVAGKKADLIKQRKLCRGNVSDHIRKLDRLDTHGRREYLQTSAEAILFDAYALLSSLKAWIGYQALHAARARAAGPDDADEARLVDVIARDAREDLATALAETRGLVSSLVRELGILTEISGPATLPMTRRRRDSKAARLTSTQLLEAIEPLAAALDVSARPLGAPSVVCAPRWLDHEPYRRILRWVLEDGETLRCLAFPDQFDVPGAARSLGQSVLGGVLGRLDPERSETATDKAAEAAMDKATPKTMVAVTDRRVITSRTSAFRQHGKIAQEIPIDQVRYVRARSSQKGSVPSQIDLITRDENARWRFSTDTDSTHVDAFAAVLAESMTIPDRERDELVRRGHALIAAGMESESLGAVLTEPTGSEAATGDTQ